MTAREQLLAAQAAVEEALQDRSALITALRQRGFSLRQMASVLGTSASTVMRWGPLPEDADARHRSLDEDWPS